MYVGRIAIGNITGQRGYKTVLREIQDGVVICLPKLSQSGRSDVVERDDVGRDKIVAAQGLRVGAGAEDGRAGDTPQRPTKAAAPLNIQTVGFDLVIILAGSPEKKGDEFGERRDNAYKWSE